MRPGIPVLKSNFVWLSPQINANRQINGPGVRPFDKEPLVTG